MYKTFYSEKYIWKYRLRKAGQMVRGEMSELNESWTDAPNVANDIFYVSFCETYRILIIIIQLWGPLGN